MGRKAPAPREDEDPQAPPPVSIRTVRWLWPALGLLALAGLGLVAVLVDEIAEGGSFRFDDALLIALREPGHLDRPIGPTWLLQSAIDLSALGGFTLQWLLGGASGLFLIYVKRRAEAAWLAGSVVGASVLNAGLKSIFTAHGPSWSPTSPTSRTRAFRAVTP